MRCSCMSRRSFEASTFPLTWNDRTPSHCDTATDAFIPSPAYRISVWPISFAAYSPNAARSPGTGPICSARSHAMVKVARIGAAPGRAGFSSLRLPSGGPPGRDGRSQGANTSAAASADAQMSKRCTPCVPSQATSSRLVAVAPTIAPTVFAAYTLPTRRPGSCSRGAAAANAIGKLAPQRHAAGRIVSKQRITSD